MFSSTTVTAFYLDISKPRRSLSRKNVSIVRMVLGLFMCRSVCVCVTLPLFKNVCRPSIFAKYSDALRRLLKITQFILSACWCQLWQQSLCACLSVFTCGHFQIPHVWTRINNWLCWKYSRHCLQHDVWWMLRWGSVCGYMCALTKSNYHWKVAALLANAKCFVLLCSRLIGWLKYKTPTNALLCCNVWVWVCVFTYMWTVLVKGHDLELRTKKSSTRGDNEG